MISAVVFVVLGVAGPGPAAASAGESAYLVRAERRSPGDLVVLREAGLAVVLEMTGSLYLEGGEGALRRLSDLGFAAAVVDRDPAAFDYWVVGLRPDSDRAAVGGLGPVVHEEENWVLLRVARGKPLEGLDDARVFLTRVGHEPLAAPRPGRRARPRADARVDAPPDPLVQQIVDAVDEARILATWQDLTSNPPAGTRYSTSQGCRDASAYCLGVYQSLGIPAEYHAWHPSHAPNVVATREGAIHPENVYVATGHLDDLPSSGLAPGADDNASGSVWILEAARAMRCSAFRNTVRYLNVTGEEQGLLGSDAWAEEAENRGENVLGAINLDMPGWEGDGLPAAEDLDLDYNAPSQDLAQRFAAAAGAYGTGLPVDAIFCPSLTASDHYSFWRRGYDAVIGITDNEGYCGHGGNYPYYHQSTDTIANCGDPSFFHSVVRTGVATLAELAEPFRVAFAAPVVACGGPVRLVVGDGDLNLDPGAVETASVEVWSDTEIGPETLVLAEEGPDSMIFSAMLATTTAPPSAGDGLLSVAHGGALSARYLDAVDCDGALDVAYPDAASADCLAPLISGVGEQAVTDLAATIVWTTDEPADGEVVWGPSIPPSNVAAGAAGATGHGVALSGLTECTTYYYEVRSRDAAGNLAVDANGGQYHRFETLIDFGSGLQSCHAGRLLLDREAAGCAGGFGVEVSDLDLNLSSTAIDTVTVAVTSTTETAPEALVLVETAPDSSRFAGGIATAPGAPVAGDGIVQASQGDLLTATYEDEDDGQGAAAVSFDTAVADCAGPGIEDLRVEEITNARVRVRWTTTEPADTRLEWGKTPALGATIAEAALVTDHEVLLNDFDLCETGHLRASSADVHGNLAVADRAGLPHAFDTWDIPGLYWRDRFEDGAPGWTLQGEWEAGAPQGLGGSSGAPDPPAAYNNAGVLGTDLIGRGAWPGDYEPGVSWVATSPLRNASTWSSTRLLVHRHLDVGAGDSASIVVWSGFGTPVYGNQGAAVLDADWSAMAFDVGTLADGKPQVAIQITLQSNATGQYSGWNVDDVILKNGALPDYAACGGCGSAPSFAGLAAAEDRDACAATGVRIAWERAAAWGSGTDGTYAVHRDGAPGFVPSAGNRIASGLTGTSHDDLSPPAGQALYYLVRAENDETCSSGPNNGGVVDANVVFRAARDDASQPPPGGVGATLRAGEVNLAHVRLAWEPAPNAAAYRVYRGGAPQGSFVAVADVEGLLFEDRDELGNLNDRYYRVVALDACGNEGP